MTPTRDDLMGEDLVRDRAAEGRANRGRAAEWLWWGGLSLLLLLVTIGALSSAAAVSHRFCAACHGTATAELAQSPHKGLKCDDCHRDSGALGLVQNRLWVAGMVIESPYRALRPSGGQAQVDRQRCVDCHEKQLLQTSVKNGVRMNHISPVKENWSCTRCHRDVAHGKKGTVRATYTMGTCLQCHNSGQASLSACATCHPNDDVNPSAVRTTPTSWAITHGPNWQQTHGMGDLTTCSACHGKTYCAGCHKINMPHASTYVSDHGKDAVAYGEKTCTTCHQKESCTGCHGGVPMPHPAAFLKAHPDQVKKSGKKACIRCHAQSSCDDCHSRHVHPGLPRERLKELKARPVNVQ